MKKGAIIGQSKRAVLAQMPPAIHFRYEPLEGAVRAGRGLVSDPVVAANDSYRGAGIEEDARRKNTLAVLPMIFDHTQPSPSSARMEPRVFSEIGAGGLFARVLVRIVGFL